MAKNCWFQFKQFRIEQARAPMKVGTDGVLLGAWANTEGVNHILDVGTGTGLVALMLAQRSAARIDAVELHEAAAADARDNFANSPWKDRLTLYCDDFRLFQEHCNSCYDLIVSNPPFFVNSLKSADPDLAIARHTDTLSFEELIKGSKCLLKTNGRLAVIIPSDSLDEFRECARMTGFYLHKLVRVIPKIGKPAKRVLLEFSLLPGYPQTSELVIHQNLHDYTDEFIELTRSFYL
jgi:tRNA1Val (adenine37-N6)-methyltransferase